MVEGFGLFCRQSEDLLYAWRVRNIANHLLVGSGADLLFDFHADGLEVQSELLKDINRHSLAELNQAEQEVFGSDEIMVEPVSLFPSEREHLLGARGKIVHGLFFAHKLKCDHFSGLSNPLACGEGGLAIGRLT